MAGKTYSLPRSLARWLSRLPHRRRSFCSDSRVSLNLPLQASEDLTYGAVTESSEGEESASEMKRKLTNPVSSIWSIANQFNNFELNNGQWNNNWNFQPVMPVSLTKELEPDHAAR